jgi:stress-induced-phosphoprotein 1
MLKQIDDQGEMLGETEVLTDLQENPKAAQEHMKNPMVMGRIQNLVSAGILQVRSC